MLGKYSKNVSAVYWETSAPNIQNISFDFQYILVRHVHDSGINTLNNHPERELISVGPQTLPKKDSKRSQNSDPAESNTSFIKVLPFW